MSEVMRHIGLIRKFIIESNAIEGIVRDDDTLEKEIDIHETFFCLAYPTVLDLSRLTIELEPRGHLRMRQGMNVVVGDHFPPEGHPSMQFETHALLGLAATNAATPFEIHCRYETLHPFMDGNGRSGRALWAWQMLNHNIWPGLEFGFLHAFYYQTLDAYRSK